MLDDPFKRPDLASVGDENTDTIHLAVGRAMAAWEHAERGFAHIFGKLVAPKASSYAAQRAYGVVIAAQVRRNMIEEAASVFFLRFPNLEAEKSLAQLMHQYGGAGGRRNDLAHGMVAPATIDGATSHFLVPNSWGSKSRSLDFFGRLSIRVRANQRVRIKIPMAWWARLQSVRSARRGVLVVS